jgi:methylase of polypeptide subunit release factors
MLVIDEAHNLRTKIETYLTDGGSLKARSGTRPFDIIDKAKEAHKVVLLTATPFINTPYDVENLLAIGDGRQPYDDLVFGEMTSDKNVMYDYFKYRISKYDRNFENGDFPNVILKYIAFTVDRDSPQGQSIKAQADKKKNPAYYQTRINSLYFDNLKQDFIVDIVKNNKNGKYCIYTSYLQSVKTIIKELKDKIPDIGDIGVVSGDENTIEKATSIDLYNNYNNKDSPDYRKSRVIIITKAGAEGVSLLETQAIFLMDGVWNEATNEQIIARAVRFRSHEKLKLKDRKVIVYKLFICYDEEKDILENLKSNKFDFVGFINNFNKFKAVLKKTKSVPDFNPQEDFSLELFSKSKKGSENRKDMLKNMKFARGKARYATEDLLNTFKGYPSTDFFMFVLQKSKDNVINSFINLLTKIPTIEKTVADFPEVRKVFDDIHKKDMTDENIIYLLKEVYNNGIQRASLEIERQINNKKSNLKQYLDKREDVLSIIKQKTKLRIKQEYFTPDIFVKELILLSDIETEKKNTNLTILEPTAGWGNIILGLLEMSKNRYSLNIDMVEIQPDNRLNLQKIVNLLPSYINLAQEGDFIRFLSSKKYDYIFMNPPFHLEAKNNKQYKKDVYSYDFVKRAYAMLDKDGVLVAITGQEWKNTADKSTKALYKDAKIINKTIEWKSKDGDTGELKKGAEITKLDVSFIYLKKLVDDPDLDNKLITETNELLIDYIPNITIDEAINENIKDETVNDLVIRRNKELKEEKVARKKRKKEYDDIRKKQKDIKEEPIKEEPIKDEPADEPADEPELTLGDKLFAIVLKTKIDDIKKALLKLNFKGKMNTNKLQLATQLNQNFKTDKQKQDMIDAINYVKEEPIKTDINPRRGR